MAQPEITLDITDDLRAARTAVKRGRSELDEANRRLAAVEQAHAAWLENTYGIQTIREDS